MVGKCQVWINCAEEIISGFDGLQFQIRIIEKKKNGPEEPAASRETSKQDKAPHPHPPSLPPVRLAAPLRACGHPTRREEGEEEEQLDESGSAPVRSGGREGPDKLAAWRFH